MPVTRHVERHFTSGETVRDIVIGMSDGLTVPFALAAGLSGAVESTSIVITAGLAEIAAGSIAMGLGGYLAARSDAEHYASERRREQTEVRDIPAAETKEVTDVLAVVRRQRRGRGPGGPRAASTTRGVDRLHDAVRVGSRKARPEAGARQRGHDRGSLHRRRVDSARPVFHLCGGRSRAGGVGRRSPCWRCSCSATSRGTSREPGPFGVRCRRRSSAGSQRPRPSGLPAPSPDSHRLSSGFVWSSWSCFFAPRADHVDYQGGSVMKRNSCR